MSNRRSILAGLAALAALQFIKLKKPKAQFLTGNPVFPNFVIVTQGSSQAAIQVLKPTDHTVVTTTVSGGSNFEYWIDGAQLDWTVGLSPAQQADVIARHYIEVTQGQWHIEFSTTPANASGEIVTIIEIDASGVPFVPKTLAQAQALAPQLFV